MLPLRPPGDLVLMLPDAGMSAWKQPAHNGPSPVLFIREAALPEIPVDEPPRIIELPAEDRPVLALEPAKPEVNLEPDALPEEEEEDPEVNLDADVLPEEEEEDPLLEENEAPVLPELIDCPTNDDPVLAAIPVDDPPRITELPAEERPVLALEPPKPEANLEPDALPEELDENLDPEGDPDEIPPAEEP